MDPTVPGFRPDPLRTGKIIADIGECATRGTHGPSRIGVGLGPEGSMRVEHVQSVRGIMRDPRYLRRVAHVVMRDAP
jgi:hypothetical protein